MEIYSVVLGCVILDTIFLGVLLRVFRISPAYRHLLEEGVLLEENVFGYANVRKPGGYYKAIILTPRHLILRQNYLTASGIIDTASIRSFEIKQSLLKKGKMKLLLYLNINGKNKALQFTTSKSGEWVEVLTNFDLEEGSGRAQDL